MVKIHLYADECPLLFSTTYVILLCYCYIHYYYLIAF